MEEKGCSLQAAHVEKIANLEARMESQEEKTDYLQKKLEVIANIDKNLEVITELFKSQKIVNEKQEKTNQKLEEAIEKVADAVTQSKLDGTISFNQILKPLVITLIGGGAIYFIYQIATGLMK